MEEESENYYQATSDDVNCDEILPGIFLSSVSAAVNRDLLEILEIKSILTVANSIEPAFPSHFKYMVIQIEDVGTQDILSHFPSAIKFINESEGNVLVHCANGISRSPTVVSAFVMTKMGIKSSKEALDFVASKRSCINPNAGFRKQLQAFGDTL